MLVRMIEFDEEWSGPWIAAHPRPTTLATDTHDDDHHESGRRGRRGR